MTWSSLSAEVRQEADVNIARQRARRIAELLGFDAQDQTRIATAVSEIARNALFYAGGGEVGFAFDDGRAAQHLVISIRDEGPGIDNLEAILAGRYRSQRGMGLGLTGAKRLMNMFTIDTGSTGTLVTLGKLLPRTRTVPLTLLEEIMRQIIAEIPRDPLAEVREQNQELRKGLSELRLRQQDTDRLNAELEATSRGVVALHADLDQRAMELELLNATLAERVEAAVLARNQAEDGLRQAQKMEAVGQLTGGIAHDFNNLLQIVMGNLELLARGLPADAMKLRRLAGNAMEGGKRAASLTQRLLAFSRRQPLMPCMVEANALVTGMVDLLRRTIGERIVIDMMLAEDLWPVEADPHQLENALLNLAVNARDAMDADGTLAIATANIAVSAKAADHKLPAGDYVCLSVADTGCGMSPQTLSRVFEPFFTTKDVGKGTGLGLSMVYGFVKQSGGHIDVVSAPDQGTTMMLYLPRVVPEWPLAPAEAARPITVIRGDEVILVVEDEAAVRDHSVEVLRDLGYVVLSAADSDTALAIIAARPDIDLLFTDVVLAGRLSGKDLADAAVAALPGLRVLFTTGYARDVIVSDGRLHAGVDLISKPFSYDDLAIKVRNVLGIVG